MEKKRLVYLLLGLLLLGSMVMSACQPAAPVEEPAAEEVPAAEEEAAPAEAVEEEAEVEEMAEAEEPMEEEVEESPAEEAAMDETLGTEENPLVWAVVPSGETDRVTAGFEEVTALIKEETGLVIKPLVATEYAGVIEAMCSDPPKAQIASLATFAYIMAADRGCAEAELVSVRYGLPTYNGQIYARADSGIETIEDLKGKTFCRPDPLSTSGWIVPSITLKAAGVDPDTDLAQIVDSGSHEAAVAGVYNGDCDAGSSYVDARTRIEEDYPDVMDVIKIIEVSTDIPNDGVQYSPTLSREMRDQINAAIIKIAETETGQEALNTAYQWNAVEEHDDTFYDAFRQVLDAAGVSPEDLQ